MADPYRELGGSVLDIVERLYPFAYSVVSEENDKAIAAFLEYLDFQVLEVPSGSEVGGWVVPDQWNVEKAEISFDGEKIFDGLDTPFSVGVLSPSFSGIVDRDELVRHFTVSEEVPEAIPYFWANLYRPIQTDWKFCAPRSFVDELPEGPFTVDLETKAVQGTMKVLDFFLPGDSSETIVFNAHNCHPWQANDDISGCAVGIALMRELQLRPRRRLSYRLIIAPELIGTAHWLENYDFAQGQLIGAVLLKALGNEGVLKAQQSFDANSFVDKAALLALDEMVGDYEAGAFRTIYGNDETVFDSPGYMIPSISLTRFPFFGYHTSADTPELLSADSLGESLLLALRLIEILDSNCDFVFNGKGLISLSNLETPLYIHEDYVVDGFAIPQHELERWQLLMNCIPRELTEAKSSIDLATKYKLPHRQLLAYLKLWHGQGLLRCAGSKQTCGVEKCTALVF